MANKYDTITQLAEDTGKRITHSKEEWEEFLRTAGNLYKYPFREQMLIYAQRPEATACASIEIWNRRMFCWVNKGAKGIALIDENASRPRLKYVFDIADVHKARRIGRFPYFWSVKPGQEQTVMDRLAESYTVPEDQELFAGFIIGLSKEIARECCEKTVSEMQDLMQDSPLEGLDQVRIRETVAESVAYTILSGCGMDMEQLQDRFSFGFICEFHTIAALSLIGDTVNSQVKPVMQEIRRAVREHERQTKRGIQASAEKYLGNVQKGLAYKEKMHYNALKQESDNEKEGSAGHGIDVQAGRRLSDTRYQDGRAAGGGASEIRKDEEKIPAGEQERVLHRAASVKQAYEPPVYTSGSGGGEAG